MDRTRSPRDKHAPLNSGLPRRQAGRPHKFEGFDPARTFTGQVVFLPPRMFEYVWRTMGNVGSGSHPQHGRFLEMDNIRYFEQKELK